jgi:hypothetical protein
MNTTMNKANISAIGPWIVVILMGLDKKLGWGFEEVWYGAVASLVIWCVTWAIPNAKKAAPSVGVNVILPLLLLALLLTGCSAGGGAGPVAIAGKVSEVRSGVIDFAAADLEEASRLAHDANDRIAYQCWDYLITVAPDAASTSNGKFDGVATAFQRARNVVKRFGDGVSDDLRLNCGPLYLDAKDDVTGLAGRIAALAAKLGVKGFL